MNRFFIDRSVFATVISIIIVDGYLGIARAAGRTYLLTPPQDLRGSGVGQRYGPLRGHLNSTGDLTALFLSWRESSSQSDAAPTRSQTAE